MGRRGVVAGVGLALLCAGCAAGRSPSMAAAPLRLVYTTFGDLEVSRADDPGPAEAMALIGDFQAGVDGYDVVGGNALLPVRRPDPNLALAVGQVAAVSAMPGLQGGPLAASATLSGLAGASLAATLAAPTPTGAPGANLTAAVAAAGAPPASGATDLAPGPPAVTVAAATVAVAVPVTTPVSPALTLQGPVLDAPTVAVPMVAATSLGGASVNSLLDPLRRLP